MKGMMTIPAKKNSCDLSQRRTARSCTRRNPPATCALQLPRLLRSWHEWYENYFSHYSRWNQKSRSIENAEREYELRKIISIKGRHCTKEKQLSGASCRLFLQIGWVGRKHCYQTHLRRWGRPLWRWRAKWCPFSGCGWTWGHRWCWCSTGWCAGSQELQLLLMIMMSWERCEGREPQVSGSTIYCARERRWLWGAGVTDGKQLQGTNTSQGKDWWWGTLSRS